jgi:Flp pilus assembly pilin Flp
MELGTSAALDHEPLKEACKMQKFHVELLRREDGQTMAEYGVILTVITIGALSALTLLGGNITSALERVASFIP